MLYSEKVLDHFFHPRNVGSLPGGNGVGLVGDPSCGDFLKVCIKVENDIIADIRFLCQGCPAAIALASIMTEMARGRTLEKAAEITDERIIETVGKIPDWKMHCSNLGAAALHAAILDYLVHALKEQGVTDIGLGEPDDPSASTNGPCTTERNGRWMRMERFLAAICRICPFCMARRKWPDSPYGRFMRKIEAACPFCRAYDRMVETARKH